MSTRSPTPSRRPPVKLTARQNARLKARIHALMHQQGLSERALADRSKVGISTIRQIGKADSSGPTLAVLLALTRALGIGSLDELLGIPTVGLFGRLDEVETKLGGAAGTFSEIVVDDRPPPRRRN